MLNDTELLALNLVPTSKTTRKRVRAQMEEQSEVHVDFVCHITGTITRGVDHDRQGPLATTDVYAVLAALRDLGIDRHVSAERLTKALERRHGTSGARALVESDKKLSRCLELLQRAAKKRRVPVAGRLSGSDLQVSAVARSPSVRKAVGGLARRIAGAIEGDVEEIA